MNIRKYLLHKYIIFFYYQPPFTSAVTLLSIVAVHPSGDAKHTQRYTAVCTSWCLFIEPYREYCFFFFLSPVVVRSKGCSYCCVGATRVKKTKIGLWKHYCCSRSKKIWHACFVFISREGGARSFFFTQTTKNFRKHFFREIRDTKLGVQAPVGRLDMIPTYYLPAVQPPKTLRGTRPRGRSQPPSTASKRQYALLAPKGMPWRQQQCMQQAAAEAVNDTHASPGIHGGLHVACMSWPTTIIIYEEYSYLSIYPSIIRRMPLCVVVTCVVRSWSPSPCFFFSSCFVFIYGYFLILL